MRYFKKQKNNKGRRKTFKRWKRLIIAECRKLPKTKFPGYYFNKPVTFSYGLLTDAVKELRKHRNTDRLELVRNEFKPDISIRPSSTFLKYHLSNDAFLRWHTNK